MTDQPAPAAPEEQPSAVDSAEAAWNDLEDWRRLKRSILVPDDYFVRGDTRFFVRDFYTKVNHALEVSLAIQAIEVRRASEFEDMERYQVQHGDIISAQVIVRASRGTRHCDAVGVASIIEDTWTYKTDAQGHAAGSPIINARLEAEHNLVATARTKAEKAACEDLYQLEPLTNADIAAAQRNAAGRPAPAPAEATDQELARCKALCRRTGTPEPDWVTLSGEDVRKASRIMTRQIVDKALADFETLSPEDQEAVVAETARRHPAATAQAAEQAREAAKAPEQRAHEAQHEPGAPLPSQGPSSHDQPAAPIIPQTPERKDAIALITSAWRADPDYRATTQANMRQVHGVGDLRKIPTEALLEYARQVPETVF